ncbi:tetratricopeptide repeat protein [Dactylosporangium sp. NPDC049525]|uniref:tetratricopeptide repeat protein n=1 Tax=Dactylosporangium sp. NPDC049525 TaxID=3154730 RepID=UPI003415CBB1
MTQAGGLGAERGNDLSGTIHGPAVQAGSIHGDVYLAAPAAVPVSVPRQLLPASPHFTGRAAELAELDLLLERPGPHLVVLSGPGGVGKSALATWWAHRVAGRFDAGQLYFDLTAFGASGPADPAEVLTCFLRALAVPPRAVPTTLRDQAALFRSLTAGRDLLVLLDDAFSAAQVRAVLPASPSSLVVVTSRHRLAGLVADGAHLIGVGTLPAGDAVALLAATAGRQRVDREPGSTAELADLCGGLPLALSVAAARLAARPALSVGRVVAELAGEPGRLGALAVPDGGSVRATFDLSYRSLDAATAALYRRLAWHPGRDFGPDLAAALAPGGGVERLLDANLLQEVDQDRFRFHVLVRLHARQQSGADEPAAARLAMLEWCLAAAGAADGVLTPYRRRLPYRSGAPAVPVPDGRAAALAWLERERGTLVDAVRVAHDLGRAELAWHLAYALWPLFLHGKYYRDRLEVDRIGVEAARAWGNSWAEAVMLKRLGRVSAVTGDLPAALRHTGAAIELYRGIGDEQGHADAVEGLAEIRAEAGDTASAIEVYTEVLAIRRILADHRSTALTLVRLGSVLTGTGRPDEALPLLREAHDSLADADPHNAARAAVALAAAHLGRDEPAQAERIATGAAVRLRELGSEFEFAAALDVLGRIARRRGDTALAIRHFTQAGAIFEAAGSRRAGQVRRQLDLLTAP